MARTKTTVIECDRCGKMVDKDTPSSAVTFDVNGGKYLKADFCDSCTAEIATGTERKRPAPRKKD